MASKINSNVSTEKIREYLYKKIDTSSPVEVEKVARYLKHIEMYREMDKTIKKEGVSVTTQNASQTFVKSHPLLNEMSKVNSSIMNIERTFKFIDEGDKPKYDASDLM